ncbi:hypothetical protein E1573_01355 [Pseudomonas sp. H9]|nr:hypothetical protein E1573_01355 [Pseudomonas sp. H9]
MLTTVSAMRHHPVVNQQLGSDFVMVYCENKRQDHLAFLQDISGSGLAPRQRFPRHIAIAGQARSYRME